MTECDCDIVWRIDNGKFWRNSSIWERTIFSISFVSLYYKIQGSVDWFKNIIFEITKNRDIYVYIPTLISCTVPVSIHKSVNEPIQRHTAVHYNSRLRWTATNLRHHQSVTHFYSSDVRALLEAKCSLRLVAGFCLLSVESLKNIRGEEV